jgi:thymidine kinase
MFLEPRKSGPKGWIEVICGSMFSGKTEELIRRLKRAQYANLKVEIFKPVIDTRYDEEKIVSHDSNSIKSTPVNSSANLLLISSNIDVVGIDEAQFFDDGLPEVIDILAGRGIRIIVAGLDMDFMGQPFGPIPALMSKAEYVTKVHAICMVCGDFATHSFRTASSDLKLLLGEKDSYEPRCRICFNEGMKTRNI